MNLLIRNAVCYIDGAFKATDLHIANGKIVSFQIPCCSFLDIKCLDLQGNYLVPGFIDIHTHGAVGTDINHCDVQHLNSLGAFFASKGTTAYLASVLTDSVENTSQILETIAQYCLHQNSGATLLGAHLEGPFLSAQKKGAMPQQHLRKGDRALLRQYLQSGCVKYITIAPEIEGGLELIAEAAKHLRVAIGHSAASYDTSLKAIDAGAVAATHTFNAMAGIDRVEPHILGAALDSDIYCEIIADGKHVHPANLRTLYRIKGKKKIIAVTDSIEAAGMPEGEYQLGENSVSVSAGEAFITGTRLRAGSVLTMDAALKNLMKYLDISIEQALPMLTENAADLFGLNKGYIRIGYDADFAVLDKDYNVMNTIIGGTVQ